MLVRGGRERGAEGGAVAGSLEGGRRGACDWGGVLGRDEDLKSGHVGDPGR